MTPSGIETATFRFVAQHLNHCATAVPSHRRIMKLIFTAHFRLLGTTPQHDILFYGISPLLKELNKCSSKTGEWSKYQTVHKECQSNYKIHSLLFRRCLRSKEKKKPLCGSNICVSSLSVCDLLSASRMSDTFLNSICETSSRSWEISISVHIHL